MGRNVRAFPAGNEAEAMKIFRKILLTALLAALLTVSCFAGEAFHAAYLKGFPDGTLRPEQAVTRAELAEILYRLMEPAAREEASDTECGFLDLGPSHWAYGAVSALCKLRVLLGGTDGRFRPQDGVTGPELSIILERIRASEAGRAAWPVLASGWEAEAVTFEAGNGWVMGLFDGIFQKDRAFTRSELAALLNRLLGREPDSLSDLPVGMPLFSDNLDTTNAAFLPLQEAAVDHTAERKNGHERWTGLG